MTQGVITISRQHGCGGRLIAEKLAERLHIPLYDQELISLAVQNSHIHRRSFEHAELDGFSGFLYPLNPAVPFDLPLSDQVFLAQSAAIRTLAEKGACIMVGRCADDVLKDHANLLKVFLFADLEVRKDHLLSEHGSLPKEIERQIAKTDAKRAAYYHHYTQKRWGASENYHLSLDTGRIGMDGTVAAIEAAYAQYMKAV